MRQGQTDGWIGLNVAGAQIRGHVIIVENEKTISPRRVDLEPGVDFIRSVRSLWGIGEDGGVAHNPFHAAGQTIVVKGNRNAFSDVLTPGTRDHDLRVGSCKDLPQSNPSLDRKHLPATRFTHGFEIVHDPVEIEENERRQHG